MSLTLYQATKGYYRIHQSQLLLTRPARRRSSSWVDSKKIIEIDENVRKRFERDK